MKICIYSPYIPKHFGGGEKYLCTVAQTYAQQGTVYIAISSLSSVSPKQNLRLRKLYEDFLGYPLHKNINFIASPLGTDAPFFDKLWWTRTFDVLYYATDGSLFFSLAKRNILHVQIPFTNQLTRPIDRLKLKNWHVKNTNSKFTKKIIEANWKTKIDYVHYPVIVKEEKIDFGQKEKVILHVGRFFRQLHSKRQDILVEIFSMLKAKGWKLLLVGTVEDKSYFQEVKKLSQGMDIKIQTNVSRSQLLDLYRKASIYWHATGFGVDDTIHPEKVEHFGISTVEAMSFGCAPIVIKKGGQKEIASGSLSSLLWETKEECVAVTTALIENKNRLKMVQEQAITRARFFSQEKFDQKVWRMTNEK
jgi:glycosyltransferase involved in cell wall biosynthesis